MSEPLKRLPKDGSTGASQPPAEGDTRSPTPPSGMSNAQVLILVGLALVVMCVLGGLIFSVVLNRDLLFGTESTFFQTIISRNN